MMRGMSEQVCETKRTACARGDLRENDFAVEETRLQTGVLTSRSLAIVVLRREMRRVSTSKINLTPAQLGG